MKNYGEKQEEVNWKEIILPLTERAIFLASNRGWFRGGKTDSFLKGKTAKDYASEAILSYLENPEKYKPEKSTLLNYLTYNVMRSLISNDLKKKENRVSRDETFLELKDEDQEEDVSSYAEIIHSNKDEFLNEELDIDKIIDEIEDKIKDKEDLQEILFCIKECKHPRKEYHDIFKKDVRVYDNGIRQIKTIAQNITKKYKIKSLKL